MNLNACFNWRLFVLFFFTLLTGCSDSSDHSSSTQAQTGSTPLSAERINLDPDIIVNHQLLAEEAARQYLAAVLPDQVDHLEVSSVHSSLLASHVYFRYHPNDFSYWGYGVSVSIDMNSGRVLRSVLQLPEDVELITAHAAATIRHNLIDVEQAKEAAWQYIGVGGKLLSPIQCELFQRRHQDRFIPSYRVRLHVTVPYGGWQVWVNAIDGLVLSVQADGISAKPMVWPAFPVQGAPIDRLQAEQQLAEHLITAPSPAAWLTNSPSGLTGQARIFDPDPITVLADDSLSPDLPLTVFEPAYTTVILKNLRLTADGDYRLCGPHVCLEDLEAPDTPISTTADGVWDATRSEPAFWEAMVYHHIDSNQRYLRSLGYFGERTLIDYPLRVDADGCQGADISYAEPGFDGSGSRIAFGRGGVPDAEDADVILHEYAHTLQYAINLDGIFDLGDNGAIAEGMANYWAASWSLRSEAGQNYRPNRVFQWDYFLSGGIQLDVPAWYDPQQSYQAHQSCSYNGEFFMANELWSRPLYLSLQRLLALGYSRSDMDKIVLESYFGFGTDITMRELATIAVHTASLLFPGGPHADILQQEFEAVNVLSQSDE